MLTQLFSSHISAQQQNLAGIAALSTVFAVTQWWRYELYSPSLKYEIISRWNLSRLLQSSNAGAMGSGWEFRSKVKTNIVRNSIKYLSLLNVPWIIDRMHLHFKLHLFVYWTEYGGFAFLHDNPAKVESLVIMCTPDINCSAGLL